MKWQIESATDDGTTIIVRIEITCDDGTVFHDQNAITHDATPEQIRALCDEMCAKHEKPAKKDLSILKGMQSE